MQLGAWPSRCCALQQRCCCASVGPPSPLFHALQPPSFYLEDDTVPIVNLCFAGVLMPALVACCALFFYRVYRWGGWLGLRQAQGHTCRESWRCPDQQGLLQQGEGCQGRHAEQASTASPPAGQT